MTSAYLSLLGALGLCYVPHAIRAYYVHVKLVKMKKDNKSVPGGYDIKNPRTAVSLATDTESAEGKFIAALTSCHYNSLENLTFIVGGVLAALQAGVARTLVDNYALAYVGLRALYIVAYIYSRIPAVAYSRSAIWAASVAVPGYLFYLAAQQAR